MAPHLFRAPAIIPEAKDSAVSMSPNYPTSEPRDILFGPRSRPEDPGMLFDYSKLNFK